MPKANDIRILLVDEHLMVREGLRLILERHPDLIIAGEAGNRLDAIEIAQRECPDIILIDPSFDEGNDLSVIAELIALDEAGFVIFLTSNCKLESFRSAIVQGARGILLKHETSTTLVKAIKTVAIGEIWMEQSSTASLFAEMKSMMQKGNISSQGAKIATLTRREREVVDLVAKGLKNKQIGEQLFISEVTVSHHLTSIFGKLGISDRLQLIVYAHRHGLTSVET